MQVYLNTRPDLSLFPGGQYDFVYSSLTLQHMKPRYSRRYIGEFVRVLAPGGLLVFQLHTTVSAEFKRRSPWYKRPFPWSVRQWVYIHLRHRRETLFELHGVPEPEVGQTIEAAGGELLLPADPAHTVSEMWESRRYTVTK